MACSANRIRGYRTVLALISRRTGADSRSDPSESILDLSGMSINGPHSPNRLSTFEGLPSEFNHCLIQEGACRSALVVMFAGNPSSQQLTSA